MYMYMYIYTYVHMYTNNVCTYFHIHIQTHTGVLGGSSLAWAPRAFRRLAVGARTERYVSIYTSTYCSQCANSYITYIQYIHVYIFLDWRVDSLSACKLKNTYSSLFAGKSMYIYTTYTYIYISLSARELNGMSLLVRELSNTYMIYLYTKIYIYIKKYTPCSLR